MNRKIFLFDGFGALISAILLIIVPYFEDFLGIPSRISFILLPFPILFSLFSFVSFRFGGNNWKLLLRMIAISNILYSFLTFYILITNLAKFKNLGIVYFALEILIIILLAAIELKVASKKEN